MWREPSLVALADLFGRTGNAVEWLGSDSFVVGVDLPTGCYLCTASAWHGLLVYEIAFPFHAPPNRRAAVANFVLRANFRVRFGALDLDVDGGELRLRSTLVYSADNDPVSDTLAELVATRHAAAERWLPGLAAVAFADMSPIAALISVAWRSRSMRLLGTEAHCSRRNSKRPCREAVGG